MKIQIDLTGSDDIRDDLRSIHNCHCAISNIINPDLTLDGGDRAYLHELLELLNSMQESILDTMEDHPWKIQN